MLKTRLSRLATVMAISSLCATNVFAANVVTEPTWPDPVTAGSSATMEIENSVVEAYLEVELPGDFVFAVNPLQLEDEETGQSRPIVTGTYTVKNRSNIGVVVSVNSKAEAAANSNVVLLGTPSYNAATGMLSANADPTKKNMWLTQMYATETSGQGDEMTIKTNTLSVNVSASQNSVSAGQTGAVLSENTTQNVLFRLDKLTNDTIQAGNVSGFKFDGAVDPNGDFKASDVKVTSTFTLKPVTTQQATGGFQVVSGCASTVVTAVSGNGVF